MVITAVRGHRHRCLPLSSYQVFLDIFRCELDPTTEIDTEAIPKSLSF